MAYDERDFLNGLAAGLAATNGRPLGALIRNFTTGTQRVGDYHSWPNGDFDIFVSRITFNTRTPCTVEYQYGPVGGELQTEFRRVQASTELQTLYHVVQLPQAVPMEQFRYAQYFYEPDGALTKFHACFMGFPYHGRYFGGWRDYEYPGSPEQVNVWMTATYRGFDINGNPIDYSWERPS